MRVPFISIAAVAAAIIVGGVLLSNKTQAQEESVKMEAVRASVVSETVEETVTEVAVETVEETKEVEEEAYESPINFTELKSQNADVQAWITIEDTNVDYPVMNDGTENYLHINFDGEKSSQGSLFVDPSSDDSLTIIYGHNMKNGSMFHDVDRFNGKDFFESHKSIKLYEEDKESELQPVVCMYGKADDSLRGIKSAEDLRAFAEGKTISNGSIPEELGNLVILVTCNYAGSDYRTYLVCEYK